MEGDQDEQGEEGNFMMEREIEQVVASAGGWQSAMLENWETKVGSSISRQEPGMGDMRSRILEQWIVRAMKLQDQGYQDESRSSMR